MRPRRSRTASHDGWVVRPQAEDHGLLCLTGSVPGRRLLVAGAARVHHRRRAVSGIGGPDGVVQPRPPSRRDRVHLHAPDRDGSDPRGRHQPTVAGHGRTRVLRDHHVVDIHGRRGGSGFRDGRRPRTATYLRARPAPRFRRALLDLLMVSGPGFAAFIGWAAVSWLITGQAFAQFTSQYGNTAILEQSGQTKPDFGAGLVFAAVCISLLAPTLVPIAVWGTVRRWRRPNWQLLLVPVTIYGAALAFQAYSYASGSTFPFLRFYIIAIPLSACLAMLAVPEGQLIATTRRGNYAPPQQPPDI